MFSSVLYNLKQMDELMTPPLPFHFQARCPCASLFHTPSQFSALSCLSALSHPICLSLTVRHSTQHNGDLNGTPATAICSLCFLTQIRPTGLRYTTGRVSP